MCSLDGSSLSLTIPSSSHFPYGAALAKSSLISPSSMMRPCSISTKNIFPGCKRPFRSMFSAGKSRTPTSDARTTSPSFVTQ